MADLGSEGISAEHDFPDGNDILSNSDEDDDSRGFVFEPPKNVEWEKDPNGELFHSYYKDHPCGIFQRTNCGPGIDKIT